MSHFEVEFALYMIEYCTWLPNYKWCLMVRQQGNLCLHGRNQGAM